MSPIVYYTVLSNTILCLYYSIECSQDLTLLRLNTAFKNYFIITVIIGNISALVLNRNYLFFREVATVDYGVAHLSHSCTDGSVYSYMYNIR